MIEIGDKPILWHIMKMYSAYGYNDFIICGGYKQYVIKEYFANYFLYNSDITFDFQEQNKMTIHNNKSEPWKVTIVDTGLNTMTGGRIKRIQPYIGDEPFMLTYGDGVADVNIEELLECHKAAGRIATLTACRLDGRFGVLEFQENLISSFREKSKDDTGWINCGFMVMEPEIFQYLENDETVLEREPLERLAAER